LLLKDLLPLSSVNLHTRIPAAGTFFVTARCAQRLSALISRPLYKKSTDGLFFSPVSVNGFDPKIRLGTSRRRRRDQFAFCTGTFSRSTKDPAVAPWL